MTLSTSALLDSLRITASLTVFVGHCALFWNPNGSLKFTTMGHGVVIVFFVISGYVITCSTLTKNHDCRQFAVARLARLYSVVLPALFLTFLLKNIGAFINPCFYASLSRGHDTGRYILTGCFLQNTWTFAASPPT